MEFRVEAWGLGLNLVGRRARRIARLWLEGGVQIQGLSCF